MRPLAGARVLITGASGRIGSETSRRLTAAGAHVTGLSLSENPDLVADRILVGDTTSEEDVAGALEGVDLVVHLSALAHRDIAPGFQVYSTNVLSTYNVLAQAAQRGVTRAVVAGSINRNGIPQNIHEGILPAYFPIDDSTPVDIADWYSLSKYNDENTSRMAWRHWGIDVITLRFPHVNTEENLLRQTKGLTEDPSAGIREGWSYLDVRDAARSIELSLTADARGAHAFYLAADRTNSPYRTDDLLDAFAPNTPRLRRFAGREVPMDLTPAREIIGFHAHHELEIETIALTNHHEGARR